ncbi:MAG: dihydrolipoyl dehydrogenase family protein [Solirubrobacteraceae bacterium]
MSDPFDVVVIGAGPAGEHATLRLHGQGRTVALVERELIGGECAYWGCIPSKTLLRSPETRAEARRAAGVQEPAIRWPQLAEYRDYMIRGLDDSGEVARYGDRGVTVVKDCGRILEPGRVQAGDRVLETERIVIATGSAAAVPEIEGLGEAGYWTNREATTLRELPDSVVVLGGGAVGIELGQFLGRMGATVTVVDGADRLLVREEPAVSERAGRALADDGVEVLTGTRAEHVRTEDGRRVVSLQGGGEIRAQQLLVATGRCPRVHGIGLEALGIEPDPEGIAVDERCRAADGVWAIGDVTGVMPFTHVGKYQARIAAGDIAGDAVRADYSAIPRVVFSDPEIAAVGLTEQRARERGIEILTAQVELPDAIARPYTYEQDPRGTLGLVADAERQILIGAWAWAPLASEWIHYAALAIKAQLPLDVLRDTVAQFPTYTEAFLVGVGQLG